MKKKKLKRLIGAAIAITLSANSISYATIKSGEETDYAKLLQSVKEGRLVKPANDTTKISSDIDITSDELISVIVEFVSEPLAVNNEVSLFTNAESKVQRDHRVFDTFLGNIPQTYSNDAMEITQEYYTVYNGVAMKIKASELENLLKCDVVKRIHKDYEVKIDTLNNDVTPRGNIETNEIEPFMMDSIPFLNIDTLHEEGITGEGIKVGVLDTGIDYNHPDLKNAYSGFKSEDGDANNQDIDSVKGWDFVDNDADPMETTYSDWKVSGEEEFDWSGTAYYTAHGTHVSGTIAGKGENTESENPVLGVAPDVELYGYRVLGPRGSGAISAIIAGIEKSVADGMDVINMSLGDGNSNDPFNPMVTAVNNATLAGVVTVIANGNAGPNAATVSSPATAQLPISVGASTVDFRYDTYDINLEDIKVNAEVMVKDLENKFETLENKDYEIVYCGLGSVEEFENIDVKGKIALIDRGDLMFVEKLKNAKDAGAAFVIMANNTTDSKIPYFGEMAYINTLAVSLEDGQAIKDNINKKTNITKGEGYLVEGDEITDFSSVGPIKTTYEIRPDVVAPGSQVFSTVPEYINDKNEEEDKYGIAYERMSGTSMATPHVAGIAALVLAANPDYTPEDVKAALMNTSEKITKQDGSDYSVHQIGAGRVNPYESVHENVSFKAEYEVTTGIEKQKLTNITGMLSFGRVYRSEDSIEATEKVIPVTITNNSTSSKTYNVSVGYSNSDRALSAEENNVELHAVDTVTVAAGESETFDAKLVIPQSAALGTYEGYIYFKDASNEKDDYQMPFAATLSLEGFTVLDYPDMGGTAKGLTAFNTSALFYKNPQTYYSGSEVTVILGVSEPITTINTFVKDINTGDYIGHAGSEDGQWIPEDIEVLVTSLIPGGRVSKIVDNNVTEERIPLENGIYELEFVIETYEGKTFTKSLPVAIINDTNSDQVTFNFDEGIIEVTDDLFTTEVWYDDEEHEGIWLKANVFNGYVDEMKNWYGLDYLKQEELNAVFASGYYPDGYRIGMDTMPKENGEVVVAGVERSDLEDGFFRTEINYTNAATVSDKPYNFIFVKEGTQYLSLDSNIEKVSEGTLVDASISLNNGSDITEGTFTISNFGDAVLEVVEIQTSEELEKLLEKNNNKIEVSYEKSIVNDGFNDNEEFKINFKVTGDNVVGLSDDIKLFDVIYNVKEFVGATEDLINNDQYRYMNLRGTYGEFKNSKDELVDVKVGTMEKTMSIESKERTFIYGNTSTFARGMKDATVYALDPSGNRYEPTYFAFDEMTERGHAFAFNDLPIIDGDYKVILETPGGFNSIVDVPGHRLNSANEKVGNTFAITSYSFLVGTPLEAVLGDVNDDGVIDILDAKEIGKLYEPFIYEEPDYNEPGYDEYPQSLSEDNVAADLTQDGVVNFADMSAVLQNYLRVDYLRDSSKMPQEVVDGNDIYDILESCGYFDEQPDMNVTLEADKTELNIGESISLNAIPPIEGISFAYEFSVRSEEADKWTVIQNKGENNTASWTAEKAGTYGIKVRIFLDEISYVWQDNIIVTVNQDAVNPGEPENPGQPEKPGDNSGNDGQKPGDGCGDGSEDNGQKPGDDCGDGSGDNGQNPGDDCDDDSENDESIEVKPSEDENKPNNNNTNNPSNNEGKEDLPQTGGTNSVMILGLGLLITAAGTITARKKK